MNYVNITPHTINLNDGREFKSEGICRVSTSYSEIKNDICTIVYGGIDGLPKQKEGTKYIVSLLVLQVVKEAGYGRTDCVAPASAHPETIRNEKGHIVSVPCFIS